MRSELKGLGFIVPVLLPGTACLSAPPPPALERWLGGAPKGGAKGECAGVEPRVGLQVVLLLGGGGGAGSTVRLRWDLCVFGACVSGLDLICMFSVWFGNRSHMAAVSSMCVVSG